MSASPIATWHRLVREADAAGLPPLLDEDVVFLSPVVHSPQRGKEVTLQYLSAAFHVLDTPTFRYVREIVGPSDAALEFEVELGGLYVNGIDLIKWNESGRIVEFKVMIRPLKAIKVMHQRMAAAIQGQLASV